MLLGQEDAMNKAPWPGGGKAGPAGGAPAGGARRVCSDPGPARNPMIALVVLMVQRHSSCEWVWATKLRIDPAGPLRPQHNNLRCAGAPGRGPKAAACNERQRRLRLCDVMSSAMGAMMTAASGVYCFAAPLRVRPYGTPGLASRHLGRRTPLPFQVLHKGSLSVQISFNRGAQRCRRLV